MKHKRVNNMVRSGKGTRVNKPFCERCGTELTDSNKDSECTALPGERVGGPQGRA